MTGHGQVRGLVEESGASPSHSRRGRDGVVEGVHPMDDQGTSFLNVQGQRVPVFAYQDVQGVKLGPQRHRHVEGHNVRAGRRAIGKEGVGAGAGGGRVPG